MKSVISLTKVNQFKSFLTVIQNVTIQ